MTEKIYVGGAKAIQTQHGGMLKVSFNRDDLQTMMSNLNEKGWINLNVSKRREVSQYGQTHSISVDTWQPDQQNTAQQPARTQGNQYQGQHPSQGKQTTQPPARRHEQEEAEPAFLTSLLLRPRICTL